MIFFEIKDQVTAELSMTRGHWFYYYNRVQEHPDCSHFRHNYISRIEVALRIPEPGKNWNINETF